MSVMRFIWAVIGMAVFSGCTLGPDRFAFPVDSKVVQVGVALQPKETRRNFTVVRVSPLWWDDDAVLLANVGGLTGAYKLYGVSVAGVTAANGGFGLSAALLENSDDYAGIRLGAVTRGRNPTGVQLGLVNHAENPIGLQFGLLNMADNAASETAAVQVGLLNWNGLRWQPFFAFAVGLPEPE